MADGDASAYTEVGESFQGFCCMARQYFNKKSNLVDKLEISPRVIIYKRRLKVSSLYQQSLCIRNRGLFARRLKYYTDSPLDTRIDIPKNKQIEDLQADETIYINIDICPKEKANINRRRHIYIVSEHPNITFEVPIIIVAEVLDWPSTPEIMNFPSTIPKCHTFYESIIYNSKSTPNPAVLKTLNQLLEIDVTAKMIPKHDYIKVLFKLMVKDMLTVHDVVKIKFSPTRSFDIHFKHKPIESSLYLSTQHLPFEVMKFERTSRKEFRACNESSENPVRYTVRFLTDIDDLDTEKVLQTDLLDEKSAEEEEDSNSVNLSVAQTIITEPVCVQDILDIDSYKHFGINSKAGQIKAKCSNKFTLVFHPVMFEDCIFPEDVEPPFLVASKLIFDINNDPLMMQSRMIISGLISGPEMEIKPTNLDARVIYLGEEYCEQIIAQNIDGEVSANVYFVDYQPLRTGVCIVTPEHGFKLDPCKKGVFLVTLFTTITGKFSLKLRFKVHNGKFYNVIIRGSSHPVEPKMFPSILELGNVDLCVPIKSRVLFMNPLAVPMTIHMRPMDDGTEIPLILDINNTTKTLPITVNNPVKTKDSINDPYDINEFPEIVLTKKAPSLISMTSVKGSEISLVSTKFEEEVLEKIPQMAPKVLSYIKSMRAWEKSNIEKKITKNSLCSLIELDYFHDLTYANYKYMNWNSVPNDPREIYVDTEILYLQPNTGKKITVLVIPNTTGSFHRYVEIRGCPIFDQTSEQDEDSELPGRGYTTVVDSTLMVSKLWIEYNCQIPKIHWTQEVVFDRRTIYAGEAYTFNLSFENNSEVGGFIYFDVVPGGADGEMFFVDNTWKYYIQKMSVINSYCGVIFRKFGDVRLSGICKIVGSNVGRPFHLMAHVLPNRVHVSVKSVTRKVRVLQESVIYIYITNITPTRTWITLSLKNDDFQSIEPEGIILGPTGHGFYVTLYTKFYDPDYYRNILYVNVRSGHVMDIPIIYDVWGMPIFFEPNIKEGLNAGIILTTSEEDFNADLPKFKRDIKVINRGYRFYRLTIQKTKNSPSNCIPSSCTTPESKARLSVSPKNLMLPPFSEDFIHITANSCEDTTITNEFRIEIVDQEDKTRVESIRFVVTAKFIYPELLWSKKEVLMTYCRTHRQKERLYLEMVKLINIADVGIDNVNLKVLGPFKARELFEHPFKKELDFKIGGAEKKELTIFLNKGAITDKFCTHVDGRILCVANDKIQRSLKLRVIIRNPELKISQPEMILFTDNRENTALVELENNGCLEATFKWKKMVERTDFVGEYDDAKDFAKEILSDLFRMLEFGDSDDELESESEHNMTLRYQKYRCKLLRCSPPDPIGVNDILMEIIDNLDLEHKRWIVRLNDDDTELNSMGSFVNKTLDRILNALKIEDSFELSEASSESCEKERNIYFCEKMGVLNHKEKVKLQVHLPGVRKGYAHQAIFRLDVIGGTSHQLQIIAINLDKAVELSRDNIYLGMRPWYEQYKAGVKVQNVTNYTINIMLQKQKLFHNLRRRKFNRIADGYVEIETEKFFNIPHMGTKLMKFTGIMGFSEEFIREVKLVINDGEERPIRLRGQGIMPIFSVISNLSRLDQDQVEIAGDYELLRRIYYFDVFRGITEEDDDLLGIQEETEEQTVVKDFSDISSILSLSGSSMSSRTAERRLFKLLRTYVMVINNAELPNATILEQLLETEKFLEALRNNADTSLLLQMVYQSYVKEQKVFDPKIPFSLKLFTIQSLPFGLHGYVLNMGTLKINQLRKFEIDLHFFGPGKLRAAARTSVRIPGLIVDFKIQESATEENHDFVFYSSEATEADFLKKAYRNIYERDLDLEKDPKLKHAHSFDVDAKRKHQRHLNARERKILKRYYNSLNKSVYMERKHHVILCKIYAKCQNNFSGTKMQVVIFIKPTKQYYEDDQLIEDYIYIDLHMGPTLPILLRGMIRF